MLQPEQAQKIAEALVGRGTAAGATAADVLYVGERSSGVQVRLGELESVSRSENDRIGLRLFVVYAQELNRAVAARAEQ